MGTKYVHASIHVRLCVIEEFKSSPEWRAGQIAANLTKRGHKISRTAVQRIIDRFCKTGTVQRSEHEQHMSLMNNYMIQCCVVEELTFDDQLTAAALKSRIPELSDYSLSAIRKLKRDLGYKYHTTQYCQMIRAVNKIIRTRFCEILQKQFEDGYELDEMVFVDEAKFEVNPWAKKCSSRKGQANKSKKPAPKHKLTVYIFAGISKRGRTVLKIFDGIMCADDYIQILDECVVPWAKENYRDQHWRLWQDNDPKHVSRMAKDYIKEVGIDWFRTPAESPDINPIEKIWSYMKWYCRDVCHASTLEELKVAITQFWTEKVTVDLCRKFINHTYKVVPKVIEAKGEYCGK